jgi:hypothetical protein
VFLKISAAMLDAFAAIRECCGVARASCGEEAPFPKRPDPGRGIFALLGGRTHRATDCGDVRKRQRSPFKSSSAGAEDSGGGREPQNRLKIHLQPKASASSKIPSRTLGRIFGLTRPYDASYIKQMKWHFKM